MQARHYLAALDVVNTERRAMGLPPLARLPEGTPGDPRRCAIARAIPGAHVQVASLAALAGCEPAVLADLEAFVRAFDTEAPRGSTCDPATLVDGGVTAPGQRRRQQQVSRRSRST